LAIDYMVFNVTKDDIRVRMTAYNEEVWPLPATLPKQPADPSQAVGFTDFIAGGRVVYTDVINALYKEINEEYGTNVRPPR
jgi:ribonuclease Z